MNTATTRLPPSSTAPSAPRWRAWYLRGLTWAFMVLTTARLLGDPPAGLAMLQTRGSRNHSVWTWLIWVGANLSIALWMYENNGHQMDKAIGVSLANAVACGAAAAGIVWCRF